MDRIGNTDGVNLDSCRNAVVENIYINNSDDGEVCCHTTVTECLIQVYA